VTYKRFWLLIKYWSTKRAIEPRQPSPLPNMFDIKTGNNKTELAKMIGTTPD
jgi:hypothetical protein